MSTQVSSLAGGGVKRVIRGTYHGWEGSGKDITIPEVNPDKTVVNMATSAFYQCTDNSPSGSTGGWAGSIYCVLKDSKTVFVRNLVEMYNGSSARPIEHRYVAVSWEVIEYV
ncbi:hypothetical protein PA25_19310 [Pseudoalteromonas sp. A25]|uniref:hypothetical protein n=1 Tax=Pseudoalteromonas sp. A25 TaxID=116092 RepID=UPI0012606C98|nr:hypothetical protein [Pseudoalteromonas sp. A25]BBN81946.1 hypothetical protein PA25_19310 [Pseudoalteromonas sp. A25]